MFFGVVNGLLYFVVKCGFTVLCYWFVTSSLLVMVSVLWWCRFGTVDTLF